MSARELLGGRWVTVCGLSPIVSRTRKREMEQLVEVFGIGDEPGLRRDEIPRFRSEPAASPDPSRETLP